jgi:hypothetical protein
MALQFFKKVKESIEKKSAEPMNENALKRKRIYKIVLILGTIGAMAAARCGKPPYWLIPVNFRFQADLTTGLVSPEQEKGCKIRSFFSKIIIGNCRPDMPSGSIIQIIRR